MDKTVSNRHYAIYHIALTSLTDNISCFCTGADGEYVPEIDKDRVFIQKNLKKKADCIAYAQMELIRNEGSVFSYGEAEDRFINDFFIIDWNASERDGKIRKQIEVSGLSGTLMPGPVTCTLDELVGMVFCRGILIGGVHYVKFEQSGSMTRNNRVSFIRKDWYDILEERITLGLQAPMPDQVITSCGSGNKTM